MRDDVVRVAGLAVAAALLCCQMSLPLGFPRPTHRGNRETILSILGYLRLGSSPQIIVWKRAAGGRRVKEDEDAGPKWAIVADTDAALGKSTTRSARIRTGGIISVGTC